MLYPRNKSICRQLSLSKNIPLTLEKSYFYALIKSYSTKMATREIRPRAAKITDAFNTSKLSADISKLDVKKSGGPQKFTNTTVEKPPKKEVVHKNEPSFPMGVFSTSSKDGKPSGELVTPSADSDSAGDGENLSEISSLSSLSRSPSPVFAEKSKPNNKPKTKKAPLQKKNKLKYPPGVTPYPDLERPTRAECMEVAALLTAAHGPAIRPETVPKPDNTVSGCGEVPSVLDALARTVLSANTTSANSSRAFKGLLDRFGTVPNEPEVDLGGVEVVKAEDGETKIRMARKIGEGSLDWDKVRKASMKEVVESIKSGGMANTKAKHIKSILDVAWEEGNELKRVKEEEERGVKTEDESCAMIRPEGKEEEDGVSLEYLRDMGDDEVMTKLMSFDGVGCKTASCVAMFCLARPKFPVDTHVWRISKYLSWIPEKATREDAYHHLDTRIPNELKYSLHCLLIRHGRMCKHCKAGPESTNTTPPKKKSAKRSREDDDEMNDGESSGKKMKTKKVWIGTGMMKEVVVEVPDDGIELGPGEESLEVCVLEQLIGKRIRKPRLKAA